MGFTLLPMCAKPFKFQAAWMEHHGFENFLVQHWQDNLPLVPTLQHLEEDLQKWNTEVFGDLFRRKRQIWARLKGV